MSLTQTDLHCSCALDSCRNTESYKAAFSVHRYRNIQKRKALTFALSSLLFTATVLEGLFAEYHSSSAALGQQRPKDTKQPLVRDWSATSEALRDVNLAKVVSLAKSFIVI